MNLIDKIEKKQIETILAQREVPEFGPGDTLKIDVKVVEGTRCLLYTSPSPRDVEEYRMPYSA